MATSTKARKTAAPKSKSAPRAELSEKEPTQLHTDFVDYIEETTGYKADLKSVQLATLLRMDFQRSDTNQARLAASKQAKAEAEAERERKRQERADKAKAKEAAKAEKSTAAKKTAAAPAAKKTAAKKAPAKKAPARRRRATGSEDL